MKCSPCCEATTRWTIFVLSIFSFILSLVVVLHCKFLLRYEYGLQLGAGLFTYEEYFQNLRRDCIAYDYELSGPHKTSRAFGVLAILCTFFAITSITSVIFCLREGKRTVWIVGIVLLSLATVSEALTFVAFNDPFCDTSDCDIGPGARAAFVNIVILVILAILSCLAPLPDTPVAQKCCGGAVHDGTGRIADHDSGSGENVNIIVTKGADGKTTTVKEVTHRDGTKTTTTTIEELQEAEVLPA